MNRIRKKKRQAHFLLATSESTVANSVIRQTELHALCGVRFVPIETLDGIHPDRPYCGECVRLATTNQQFAINALIEQNEELYWRLICKDEYAEDMSDEDDLDEEE